MSRRLSTLIALLLVAAAFGSAVARLISRRAPEILDPAVEVVRFAHWQLEPGVREALEAIAADYEALHPGVRIEQVPVPGRVWRQWLNTQLVGGTAPDLVEIASYINPDDQLARHFLPLTAALEEPNPYNAAEPDLRDVPWRLTYTDALIPVEGVHYFSHNLLEYYGAPSAMVTVRVFYNRALMVAAIGEDRPPATYLEFIALCEALQRHGRETGRVVQPLAGSVFNVTRLTDSLFNNATQRFALELDVNRDLEFSRHEALITHLRGRWSVDSAPVRQGLKTVEAVAAHMLPGWIQLQREDAVMQFLQQHAAMIATGTWDAAGLMQQAPFEVGAFRVPAIARDDPEFGRWSFGPESEANIFASLPFGITRSSRHPGRALDFLRFLTSRRSNAKFAEMSTWLPVVRGVPVPQASEAFAPLREGQVGGVNIRIYTSRSHDILVQHLHLLSGAGADVDRFVAATTPLFRQAVEEEALRQARIAQANLRQQDSVLPAQWHLEEPGRRARSKFDRMAARQIDVMAARLQLLQAREDPGARR